MTSVVDWALKTNYLSYDCKDVPACMSLKVRRGEAVLWVLV